MVAQNSSDFPSLGGSKSKVFTLVSEIPPTRILPPCPPVSMLSSHHTPASLACWLFLRHTACPLASCPSHVLCLECSSAELPSANLTGVSAHMCPLRALLIPGDPCPGLSGTSRFPRMWDFSAKPSTVLGKPGWLVALQSQSHHFLSTFLRCILLRNTYHSDTFTRSAVFVFCPE